MDKQNDELLNSIRQERDMRVVRSIDLVRQGQYSLSLQEQRFLFYCISKVKPDDTVESIYDISLKDFLSVCGLQTSTSYSNIRDTIITVMGKMVLRLEEVSDNGKHRFSIINWFSEMSYEEGKGIVHFQFGQRVMNELVNLARYNQKADNKLFYISDELKYMLPFRCRYSYYLYSLLRTYQNVNEWTFPMEELRQKLDVFERAASPEEYRRTLEEKIPRKPLYPRFPDFRRNVLDPAKRDINEYSNIIVDYRPVKKGRVVVAIKFIFENKTELKKLWAEQRGQLVLDRNDELTNTMKGRVPDLDDPLQFLHVSAAETSRYPGSVTVSHPDQPAAEVTAAEIRERLDKAVAERKKPKKPIEYGKRKDKSPSDETLQDFVDVEKYFQVEQISGKNYVMTLDLARFSAYAEEAELPEWNPGRTVSDLCTLFRALIQLDGAARLQEFFRDGKIQIAEKDDKMVISLQGKTPAGDLQKFLRKVFSSKSAMRVKMAVFS